MTSLLHIETRRYGNGIFEEDGASSDDAVELARRYEVEVGEAASEMERQRLRYEAAIAAVCKCKKEAILCRLTRKQATSIAMDFRENGFGGEEVKSFIKLVNEKFFSDYDYVKKCNYIASWASHLVAKEFSIMKSVGENVEFRDEFLCIGYADVKTGKRFNLEVPIAENTWFREDNYCDTVLGKYVFRAWVPHDKSRIITGEGQTIEFMPDGSMMELVTISADYSGNRLIEDIKEFLTSEKAPTKRHYTAPTMQVYV